MDKIFKTDVVSGKKFADARDEILKAADVFKGRRFRVYYGNTETGEYTGYKIDNCVGYLSRNELLENKIMIRKMCNSTGGYPIDVEQIIRIDDTVTKTPILMHGSYNLWGGAKINGSELNCDTIFGEHIKVRLSTQHDQWQLVESAVQMVYIDSNIGEIKLNYVRQDKMTGIIERAEDESYGLNSQGVHRIKEDFPLLADTMDIITEEGIFTGAIYCGNKLIDLFNSVNKMMKFREYLTSKKCYK